MSRNIPTNSLLAVLVFFMAFSFVFDFAKADVQCPDVMSKLVPCIGFLLRGDASPSVACCTGAQALDKQAAASQPDRQGICSCLEAAAKTFPIKLDKAAQLPALCKLTTKLPMDPKIDCSKI